MRSLSESEIFRITRINFAISLLIFLPGCSGSSLQGDGAGSDRKKSTGADNTSATSAEKLNEDEVPVQGTLADADTYEKRLDDKSQTSQLSEIPVQRLCSNRYTLAAQTNFFLADKGVELVFVNSANVKKVVSAGELSDTLLSDVLADGKLKVDFKALGVEDGVYAVGLCDSTFVKCKDQFIFTDANNQTSVSRVSKPRMYRFNSARAGLFGVISDLKITDGLGKSDSASILLNVNLKLLSGQKNGSNKVFAQKEGNSKRKKRLANNENKPNFLANVPKSDDPRADDVEDCDAFASPLVLDFSNNGVFGGQQELVLFDINADGRADQLANTLDNNDYLLVLDRNQNGKIDSGKELFGNYSGGTGQNVVFQNGFEALASHDSNRDGMIDAKDSSFKNLKLWQMGSSKLVSLTQKDVVSISVAYRKTAKVDRLSGNAILQTGTFRTGDGQELPMVDLWYRVSSSNVALK